MSFCAWFRDPSIRKQVLTDNPARLYQFDG